MTATETVHEATTEWSASGLPEPLQHEAIRFYRDMGTSRRAYQIGFNQRWMPFSYDLPDEFEITHARLERHEDPADNALKRLLGVEREYLVIVVVERGKPTLEEVIDE